MTLKIETISNGQATGLRLIGRMRSEDVESVRSQIQSQSAKALDLDEVVLVDVAVVRFLVACEASGIEMLNCRPYIQEWMSRERQT